MKSKKVESKPNIILNFFSSVKLAITLFILLAITSIIGTVLPQGESLQFYLENFGPTSFKIIKGLELYDTYHSWWYLSLLGLFSVNLVVCTIRRLPYTLRLYRKDALNLSLDELARRPFKKIWNLPKAAPDENLVSRIKSVFEGIGGKVRNRKDVQGGNLYLIEKGKWNYWGVYFIHVSILVIFAGAVFGSFMGFKGRIMLLEGETTDHAFKRDEAGNISKIPLNFSVKCNKFKVEFYPNGAPKLFQSDLSIIKGGKEVRKKSILVNDPLSYEGVTFYQSSYESLPEIEIKIISPDGKERRLSLSAFEKAMWPETGMVIGLIKYLPNVHGSPAARIYIGDPSGNGDALWLLKGHDKDYKIGDSVFRISLVRGGEKYMTGLQVKKDPGVWIVWLGCIMLVFGFGVVFWVPHERYWLWIGRDGQGAKVILAGQTTKNKVAFEKRFNKIEKEMEKITGEI